SNASRSTSGKTPLSASHRPIIDSSPVSWNSVPGESPLSMTSVAWAARDLPWLALTELRFDSRSMPTGGIPTDVTCAARDPDISADGGGTYAGGGESLSASPGISLVPHSSQKRDVSKFSFRHV